MRIFRSKSAILLYVCIALFLFFYIMNKNFFSNDNITGMMNNMIATGILSIGIAFLLMSGGMDLSAGSIGCLGAVFFALMLKQNISWAIALPVSLLFGIAVGGINAILINGFGFFSFIVTIAMMNILNGFAQLITKSNNVAISEDFFQKLTNYTVFGLSPVSFIITIALVGVYGFILTKTNFGRSVLMCGGNRNAARLVGLNPKKITTITYMNCGMLATLAGVLWSSRLHNANPSALSTGSLDAITAATLGGVSFMGGAGGMGGLLIGVVMLTGFTNGLAVVRMPDYWKYVAKGGLLIVAISMDYLNDQIRAKKLKSKPQKV